MSAGKLALVLVLCGMGWILVFGTKPVGLGVLCIIISGSIGLWKGLSGKAFVILMACVVVFLLLVGRVLIVIASKYS